MEEWAKDPGKQPVRRKENQEGEVPWEQLKNLREAGVVHLVKHGEAHDHGM